MRIGIDVSQIVYKTGVSHYTEKLVENLLKQDKENEYVLFAGYLRSGKKIKQIIEHFNVEKKYAVFPPVLADFIWNRLHIIPIEKFTGHLDVYHSSDWTQAPSSAFKVTTVHDLAPIIFPKDTPKKIYEVHKRRLKLVKSEVDRIIVPSHSTKEDLLKLGFDKNKIKVIHEGPITKKTNKESIKKVLKKYGIREDYAIAVGATKRKNTERIIDAFNLATAGKDMKLVIVGNPVGISTEERRGIRFLGHVSDADLSSLLTGSKVLVYPSLYEGFGQPILDAFSCGVPVVTSNVSSMPEVAGDAAVLVRPDSVKSISNGLREALGKRKTLISKGLRQVKKFSWEEAAKDTLSVYNEALK